MDNKMLKESLKELSDPSVIQRCPTQTVATMMAEALRVIEELESRPKVGNPLILG